MGILSSIFHTNSYITLGLPVVPFTFPKLNFGELSFRMDVWELIYFPAC